MFKTSFFCKLKKQQCIRRSATCWAQSVATQVDWPNSFWDMTKCLKPNFCTLKKQQCIRRSATCWAQCVDTQVDWPNSFWDMTKCLISYFCKLKKQQCIWRSATCWAQRVDTQVDWPNSFWDMTKCLKPCFFANWRNNSAFGSALPDQHNALTLRSIGPIVSEIWQNV
jgi:Holliday junction resolvase-like predicted endonuclease